MKGDEQEGCLTGANGPQREFGDTEGGKDVFYNYTFPRRFKRFVSEL